VKPLMYGYLYVIDNAAHKGQVARATHQMRRYADTEGYCYATTFVDCHPSQPGFDELLHELRRARARHIVVPAVDHVPHRLRRYLAASDYLDAEMQIHTPKTDAEVDRVGRPE
jgi:hypothetical protein